MTPFHFALSLTQAMTEAFVTGPAKFAAAMGQTAASIGANAAESVQEATGKPARSWYRQPAPSWPEIAQSYGCSQAFLSPMTFMAPYASTFGGTSFDPTRPLTATLAWQTQMLQAMMVPFQTMMSLTSTRFEPFGSSQGYSGVPTAIVPSDNKTGRGDVAVASITLPDKTTFEITVPMPNSPQSFWPWAGPFGGSSYATPPIAISDTQHDANGLDHDVRSPDRALTATIRRSYLKSKH